MNGYSLLEKMELIDPNYIEAADRSSKKKTSIWLAPAIAACLCVIFGFVFSFAHLQDDSQIQNLSESTPCIEITETPPKEFILSTQTTAKIYLGYDPELSMSSEGNLVYFSENDMFKMDNMYIFRGKVLELSNITLDFNGEKMGRCIATIEIQNVYKGDLSACDKIEMLIPCPIGNFGVWCEDSETITHIEIGMEGIFMPWIYDKNSSIKMNGAVVMLEDLAECGLADGLRWVFLSSEQGVIFSEYSYPGAKQSTSLEDIENYIIKMLE